MNPAPASSVASRAAAIYRSSIVIDAHNDLPTKILDHAYDPDVRHAPGVGRDRGETDLPRLLESGITAQFFAAFVDAKYARRSPDESFARAMAAIDAARAFVARHPGRLSLATTAAEVRAAKEQGSVAVLLGVEGGHAIQNSLDRLRELYTRGVRYLTLTWNNGNDWAGSSLGVDGTRTAGLTDFGRRVIAEMNRLGMLVDISHVSDATFDDVLAASTAPVIASHSSARALAPSPRNLTDDQLRAVAATGGVVNVNFYSAFIDTGFLEQKTRIDELVARESALALAAPGADGIAILQAAEDRINELSRSLVPPPLSVLIDHFDHVARVAGADHVGIGSDFDGVGGLLPAGMSDVTALPRIAEELIGRGWADHAVRKMLGANMLRVMERVFGV